jgi:hypothetical protein
MSKVPKVHRPDFNVATVTAAGIAFYTLYRVGQLIDVGKITGEAGMVIFVSIGSAAVGYLFAKGTKDDNTAAFAAGVLTPGPNDSGTVVTGDNPTVQSGGPTNVSTP